jgi:hypothetical protein
MLSNQLLDAGQALTVQSFKTRSLRRQALVGSTPTQGQSQIASKPQNGTSAMASLEKLHTQKKTAQSAVVAIDEIKKSLAKTRDVLIQNQITNKPISELDHVDQQLNRILKVKDDLDALRGQVQVDANEKQIFQALEKVVLDSVDFYSSIKKDNNFSTALDKMKSVQLSAISSQAQIEKVQGQLEASTFQVVRLASSYEASLFSTQSPFEAAEELYQLSFQQPAFSGSLGSVLDQVS